MKKAYLSVLIADDHDLIRQGLKSIVSSKPEYEVIAEAKDGEEVLALTKKYKQDITLLDLSMPKLGGLDIIEQIYKICPGTKVLVISVHKANIYITKAFQAGAKGYLHKENAGEELLLAIAKIARGDIYITPFISSRILENVLKKPGQGPAKGEALTEREQEILHLVGEGHTAKEIGKTLFISRRTVETYKNTLLRKLSLKSTSGLIKYAIKHGIVDMDDF
jgi:DNA-binding NarL/FixJ family response regulator